MGTHCRDPACGRPRSLTHWTPSQQTFRPVTSHGEPGEGPHRTGATRPPEKSRGRWSLAGSILQLSPLSYMSHSHCEDHVITTVPAHTPHYFFYISSSSTYLNHLSQSVHCKRRLLAGPVLFSFICPPSSSLPFPPSP